MGKSLPDIQMLLKMQVQSLDWGDPLEKGMATHSSNLTWRIQRREEPNRLQSIGSQRVSHNWSELAQHTVPEMGVLFCFVFRWYFIRCILFQDLLFISEINYLSFTALPGVQISDMFYSCWSDSWETHALGWQSITLNWGHVVTSNYSMSYLLNRKICFKRPN